MPAKTLPVLNPPNAAECCAPLALESLPQSDAEALSERFAALGDPVRLRLVSLLANSAEGAVCVCDLIEPVNRSQGTVSHHLKVLGRAGLIVGEKRGRNMWYSVVPDALESLRAALATEVPAIASERPRGATGVVKV